MTRTQPDRGVRLPGGRDAGSRTLVLALLIVLAAVSARARPGDPHVCAALEDFLRTSWVAVPGLQDVPGPVIAVLRARFGGDDRLADRGGPFKATDLDDGLPTRRLVLAARADDDWFILYERGGRGHYLVLARISSKVDPPRITFAALGSAGVHDGIEGWHVDLEALKEALRADQMRPTQANGSRF